MASVLCPLHSHYIQRNIHNFLTQSNRMKSFVILCYNGVNTYVRLLAWLR